MCTTHRGAHLGDHKASSHVTVDLRLTYGHHGKIWIASLKHSCGRKCGTDPRAQPTGSEFDLQPQQGNFIVQIPCTVLQAGHIIYM